MLKVGQKDKRGRVFTQARKDALLKAHAARHSGRKKRKYTKRVTVKLEKQVNRVMMHTSKFNLHLMEMVRFVVREELKDIMRGIK